MTYKNSEKKLKCGKNQQITKTDTGKIQKRKTNRNENVESQKDV